MIGIKKLLSHTVKALSNYILFKKTHYYNKIIYNQMPYTQRFDAKSVL